ncbi:DUF2127 domain-containing protein [Candidatus Kaiserbacteria bacterium]|nr:DUF2127 domain-containing protein [Candidatus Kaiserbacteria bacterium]
MLSKQKIEYFLHGLFEAGVALRAFNGTWEIISGTLALLVPHEMIVHGFYALSHNELLEDPHDRFVDLVGGFLTSAPEGTRMFIALYILLHGVVNLFLAYELYRNKLWAYPTAAVFMALFMFYQIYRIYEYHSITLALITIIDVVFIALLLHEYRHRREANQETLPRVV